MAHIVLQNVRNTIIKGISMEVRDGELLVIVGPSGAGKTTLLNVVAGLVPHEGRILVDGQCMNGRPPCDRHVGYLFQDLLLFPHMSVIKNIRTGLEKHMLDRHERSRRLERMMALFHLKPLADRFPHQLSGGEKQRTALARALVSSPRLLLLDEPFSSLDFRTARYLRLELKRIQAELGSTMLFVTHHLEEARDLGDRMGVMAKGRLEHIGGINDLMLEGTAVEGGFLEKPNVLPCTCSESLGNGLVRVQWAGGPLFVPDDGTTPFTRVVIHPMHVYISPYSPPGPQVNRFRARIREIHHAGGMAHIELAVGDQPVYAHMRTDDAQTLTLSSGDPVYGILKLRELHGR